ncbi:MAG: hypothetical protein OXC46_11065, partial [Thaumarchaeota archaeon]|nr:hypothetical protein [Nitrososphaerota archaeon]
MLNSLIFSAKSDHKKKLLFPAIMFSMVLLFAVGIGEAYAADSTTLTVKVSTDGKAKGCGFYEFDLEGHEHGQGITNKCEDA